MMRRNGWNMLLVAGMAMAMTGCMNSPEKRVERMVKEAVETTLYIPKSYDPVKTEIDSAFTPWNDPECLDMLLELNEMDEHYRSYETEAFLAKAGMDIYEESDSELSQTKYEQRKRDYEKYSKKLTHMGMRAEEIAEALKLKLEKEPQFIGYSVHHRYRAETNEGKVMIDDVWFLVDKEMKEIVAGYSSEELETIEAVVDLIENTID